MVKVNEVDYKKIKADFQNEWPIDKIKNMKIEEYTSINEKAKTNTSFTYTIETKLKNIGNIKGSTSLKFGIYKTKKNKVNGTKGTTRNNGYEWYERYGKTNDEAFYKIRELLVRIIDCVNNNKYDEIDNIDISHMFKWKVAYMYDNNDRILPIFDYTMLCTICYGKGIIPSNPYSTISIYDELLKHKGESSIYNYNSELIKKFIEYNTEYSTKKEFQSTFILKYKHIFDGFKTIDEHQKIIDKNKNSKQKGVLWGIFNSDTKFGKKEYDNIKTLQKEGLDYFLMLSKTNDGINILYICKFEGIYTYNEINKQKIPEYYKHKKVSYYINITNIEQVTLSVLDLYLPTGTSIENKLYINRFSIRKYFSLYTTFSFLKINNNIDNIEGDKIITKYDLILQKIKELRKIKKIIGIQYYNYYGLNRDIGYLDLSNGEYIYNNGVIDRNNNVEYNIFNDYGISNFNCILGKNGFGKSRIISSICNFFSDWQNFNLRKERDLNSENYMIYFMDEKEEIVEFKNGNYIGKNQIQNKSYIYNFSSIKNIFISNSANDSLLLENNTIGEIFNKENDLFSAYEYLGVVKGNNINRESNITILENMLLFIFLDKKNKLIFDSCLDVLNIKHRFDYISLSFLNEKDITNEIKSNQNLYELLENIKEGEYSNTFYENNTNRKILKTIMSGGKVGKSSLKMDNIFNYGDYNNSDIFCIKTFSNFFKLFLFFGNNTYTDIYKALELVGNNKYEEILKNTINYIILPFFKLLLNTKLFNIKFQTKEGLSIRDLSSGEQTIINNIIKLIFTLSKNKNNSTHDARDKNGDRNINIFFDEPDNTLHPEWQRILIKSISYVFNQKKQMVYKDGKINDITDMSLYITTHSPIILSDIPKNNIISISRDKESLKLFQDKNLKQTFLNNLYDLYANPFFLDSFVGEFAINRYREATGLISNEKLNEFKKILKDIESAININNQLEEIKTNEIYKITREINILNNLDEKNRKIDFFRNNLNEKYNNLGKYIIIDKSNTNIKDIIGDHIIQKQYENDGKKSYLVNLEILLNLVKDYLIEKLGEK